MRRRPSPCRPETHRPRRRTWMPRSQPMPRAPNPTSLRRPICQPSLVPPCVILRIIPEYQGDPAGRGGKGGGYGANPAMPAGGADGGHGAIDAINRPMPPAFAHPYDVSSDSTFASGVISGSGGGFRLGNVSSHLMMEVWSAP